MHAIDYIDKALEVLWSVITRRRGTTMLLYYRQQLAVAARGADVILYSVFILFD